MEDDKNGKFVTILYPQNFENKILEAKCCAECNISNIQNGVLYCDKNCKVSWNYFLKNGIVLGCLFDNEIEANSFYETTCKLLRLSSGEHKHIIHIDDNKEKARLSDIRDFYKNLGEPHYPFMFSMEFLQTALKYNIHLFGSEYINETERKVHLPITFIEYTLDNEMKTYVVYIASSNKLINGEKINTLFFVLREKLKEMMYGSKNNSYNKPKRINGITKSIRYEVLKRDNFKCVFCGKSKDEVSLEIDHIIPVSKGGTDELSNFQTLCCTCNLSKSNRIYQNNVAENTTIPSFPLEVKN